MNWEDIEGIPHCKFKDQDGKLKTIRIVLKRTHLTYGLNIDAILEVLTDLGFTTLHSIYCKKAGTKEFLVSEEDTLDRLKEYARKIYHQAP